jgi:hypothetical protein
LKNYFKKKNKILIIIFQDVVLMGAALEKLFYEKLAEMPADVRKRLFLSSSLTKSFLGN